MKKLIIPIVLIVLSLTSCVSKKKYVALEQQYNDTRANLQKTTLEKEKLEANFAKIEKHVEDYNRKLNALHNLNSDLQHQNDVKLDLVGNTTVISNSLKKKMQKILEDVAPSELANAKTLKDSMNVALLHNFQKSVKDMQLGKSDGIDVNIDKTVVMISVSDKLLFNTASYKVKKKAYTVIEKIANIIKSDPSIDVMVEGHTDSRTIHNAVVEDNWDLSVKRATSIVRIFQNNFGIQANRLIPSGRGASVPLVSNDTAENRAKNRRTRIVILPDLDKFFWLLSQEEPLKS
ncbi:flagellar motor protein MotB [Tenacibaculum sp. UWU-22]|uniref:OmpA/MotB family protein n=1 Tax=Tenacibaculum sp. UWU-22 TaxID=3234187 RepID=UPI0034DB4440